MPELLLVADDLTGATDAAVKFAASGIGARVIVDRGEPLDGEVSPVLAVDTGSRHLEPEEGARRVADVARRGREAGARWLFKKTDSTLRGNPGRELEALRAASGAARLPFVPALPALGRTTRGGVQYVRGIPLHQTGFAHDPLEPMTASSVPDLLRVQTDVAVVPLSPEALTSLDVGNLPAPAILVIDAESDEHVRAVARWIVREGLAGAVAGTSALAEALAEALPWSAGRAAPPPPGTATGPMLVVGGSLNPVSLAQLDHWARGGCATVHLPPSLLLRARDGACEDEDAAVASAVRHLSGGRDVAVRTARDGTDVATCVALGEGAGLTPAALHLRVAESAGRIVLRILEGHRVERLAVLGGDMLAGLVAALGYPALLPHQEVLPGIPVSTVEGFEPMLLISKAGGFGPDDVLARVARATIGGSPG